MRRTIAKLGKQDTHRYWHPSTINVILIGQSMVCNGLEQSQSGDMSMCSSLKGLNAECLAEYVVRKSIPELHCCWDERSLPAK